MRRSILLALVAALALAVGVNVATAAADGGAQATAKKKAAKKKAAKCPAKPKKGKKKAAKCKAKPKKKAKAKPKAGAFKLADGVYKHESVNVIVSDGGTQASVGFPVSCFTFPGVKAPLTHSGNTATTNGEYTRPIAGAESRVTWSLTVQSTLSYTLKTAWDIGPGACTGQKTFSGKLVK